VDLRQRRIKDRNSNKAEETGKTGNLAVSGNQFNL